MKDLHDIFAQESDFSAANLEAKFKAYLEQKQLGFGAAMPPLRLMITGFPKRKCSPIVRASL